MQTEDAILLVDPYDDRIRGAKSHQDPSLQTRTAQRAIVFSPKIVPFSHTVALG